MITTKTEDNLKEIINALIESFPNSFINERGEFIAHKRSNEFFNLGSCKTQLDIECKVLEWLSRAAYKTAPYTKEWRNQKFNDFILNGVNSFLDTNFDSNDMSLIYTHLGNSCNHEKTIKFIKSDYDFSVLK